MIKNHNKLLKMVLSAMLLALAYVMPFLTGQIPEIGSMLCPMHIPVILCGFICGPLWGLAVGAISPLLRSMILTMPPLFPMAVCMAFELAAYGAVSGLMHRLFPRKKPYVYVSLIISMLVGRLVFGTAMFICMGVKGMGYTFSAFIAGAFTEALPGIIVQLVLIPIIVMIAENKSVLDLKD